MKPDMPETSASTTPTYISLSKNLPLLIFLSFSLKLIHLSWSNF